LEQQLATRELEAKGTGELEELDRQKQALQGQARQMQGDIAKAQQELQALKDRN